MRTITLSDIRIKEVKIDVVNQKAEVTFFILDSNGRAWGGEHVETYWVTMPPQPGPMDEQLPAATLTILTNLVASALAALKAKYLS